MSLSTYSRLLRLQQLARQSILATGQQTQFTQLHRRVSGPQCGRQFHTSLLDSNQTTEKSGQGFNVSQQKFAYTESESDCYKEMPGKSTITFLNDDKDLFQVDSYNCEGFRINQGNAFILGPMVIFNNTMLSWKVRNIFDITERSLALFTILDPLPELVLIGYGSPLVTVAKSSRIDDIYESEEEEERRYTQRMKEEKHIKACNTHMAKVTLACKAKGLNVSFLPTEKAISTYNFLVTEDRLVSCAALPPTVPEWTDGYEIDDHYIKLQDDLNIGAARRDHSLMDQVIPRPKDY